MMKELTKKHSCRDSAAYGKKSAEAILHRWYGIKTQMQVVDEWAIGVHNGFRVGKPRKSPCMVEAYTVVIYMRALTMKHDCSFNFRI